MTKRIQLFAFFSISILLITAGSSTHHFASGNELNNKDIDGLKYKNVIIMVPDGCSFSTQTLARLYKGSNLNLDALNIGSVRTYSANSIITDSAAASTAFATGHKTTSGFISVGPRTKDLLTGFEPDALPYYPVPSTLEGAKYNGKSTGLVVTSVICHATPAGFSAHVPYRSMYDDIMEQIVYQDIDVVFGGGGKYLLPKNNHYKTDYGVTWDGDRKDSDNLINALKERGYDFINSQDNLKSLNSTKVWGVFNDDNLVPEIDKDELNPSQPSLADMTEKAIEILSKNEKGFFLMVEGSQVDYAGHANDPVYMVTEFLAFDEAVGVAVEFAKKDGNTLVIAFPDHNTGGLSIGSNNPVSQNYSSTSLEHLLAPIKNAQTTVQGLLEIAYKDGDPTVQEIQELFKEKWQLSLDETQAGEILKFKKYNYAVANYLSDNMTIIGWTTKGHEGGDVPLWVYAGENKFPVRGNINNTDIALKVAELTGIDLDMLEKELFIDVGTVFPDYTITNDDTGYILEIGNSRLPVNKDIVYKGGKTYRTQGVVVNAHNINKVFIPKEAVKIIQKKQE